MRFQVNDILDITGGEMVINKNISGNFSICTDTRTISPEEIFLPLSGENFDGHNFINIALDKGSRGYFIDKNHKDFLKSYSDNAKFVILVDDTKEAYLKLANSCRKKLNPIVVAITGSSGKTTTKEMVYSVLSQMYKTHKSYLNHNNEIGLCQTLLNMPENTEFLVVEMGMRALGEIELLSKYSEPDIAVITNVGIAHLGRLGSVENIAKAKCEIASHLNKEGLLVAHDNELIKNSLGWNGKTIYFDLNSTTANIIEMDSDGSRFTYKNNQYEVRVPGEYNIINALAAIEVGLKAGMSPLRINQGLMQYQPISNRWQEINLANDVKIINDSYNANPDSVKAAISAIIKSYSLKKVVLVLGDMAELGDQEIALHRDIGRFLNDKNIFELITIGDKARYIAESMNNEKIGKKSFAQIQDAMEYLGSNLEPNSVVLLKASRCMSFEKIAEQLEMIGV